MLSIEVCKQILKENGLRLNDSQIKEIREFLYKLGNIQYKENNDIFVHYSMIQEDGYKSLNEGDVVEFDLIETDKGLQAIKVCKINTKTATM